MFNKPSEKWYSPDTWEEETKDDIAGAALFVLIVTAVIIKECSQPERRSSGNSIPWGMFFGDDS